ncbi:MAG: uracil-DNA glycosylase [Candidatus Paceibacterota bacterium]|jgi:uracil-DNA glycosylase
MKESGNYKNIKINLEWAQVLKDYFETNNWKDLSIFIKSEYLDKNKKIFPEAKNVFKAFDLTPFSKVKVIILGQDPYHDDKQANGLCFSVPKGLVLPPSLKNIYKEIETDLNIKKDFTDGDLGKWAEQGVFLLNSILTVIAHNPASHRNKGWESFTNEVIKTLSDKRQNLVFMLWGNYAKSKKSLIDTKRHLVLEAPHPSPFSVHTGFFGCKHFSKCNEYLKKNQIGEIDW